MLTGKHRSRDDPGWESSSQEMKSGLSAFHFSHRNNHSQYFTAFLWGDFLSEHPWNRGQGGLGSSRTVRNAIPEEEGFKIPNPLGQRLSPKTHTHEQHTKEFASRVDWCCSHGHGRLRPRILPQVQARFFYNFPINMHFSHSNTALCCKPGSMLGSRSRALPLATQLLKAIKILMSRWF